MADAVFRMARPEALRIVHLDTFAAIYHRASGITHLVTSPAPEILGVLGESGLTMAALRARLAAQYDISEEGEEALVARLAELVASGLVEAT